MGHHVKKKSSKGTLCKRRVLKKTCVGRWVCVPPLLKTPFVSTHLGSVRLKFPSFACFLGRPCMVCGKLFGLYLSHISILVTVFVAVRISVLA